MAGHSKWANVKHRKAGQDAKKSKIFTKLIRELAVSAKLEGGDPVHNPRLRTAIDKALSHNMTRDTINRAIQRGIGGEEGANMDTILYEGYGPGGIALLISCLTDNRNRTASEVRYALSRKGARLAGEGAVSYLFEKKGIFSLPSKIIDEEKVLAVALEAGADDVRVNDEQQTLDILTAPEQFTCVRNALIDNKWHIQCAQIGWIANNLLSLEKECCDQLQQLIDALEELDDVQTVYHNGRLSHE